MKAVGLLERRVASKKVFVELPDEVLRVVTAWRFEADRDFQRVQFAILDFVLQDR